MGIGVENESKNLKCKIKNMESEKMDIEESGSRRNWK